MSEVKSKGSNKLIVILLIFTLLIVFSIAGIFGYFFLFNNGTTSAKKAVKEKTFQLDEFVTNLADESTTYVKLTIVLGYEGKALEKELPTKVASIRDTINATLWSKTSIDFSGKGTETVKKELLEAINNKLEKGKISNIYLNEIIIQ
jgi:flagellar FliL protein